MSKRTYSCAAGWESPQLQVQITPLSWGLAFTVDHNHTGIQVGPVAVVVWFGRVSFTSHREVKVSR